MFFNAAGGGYSGADIQTVAIKKARRLYHQQRVQFTLNSLSITKRRHTGALEVFIKANLFYWSGVIVSIIPTIDKKAASREAKAYLKQYHDWELMAHRIYIANSLDLVSQELEETHQRAIYECNERLKVIDTIKQDNVTSGLILFYRFLMGYRVRRTLDKLAARHGVHINERELSRQQRQGLLRAYELIPQEQTRLVK
ncbi:hypothetical protein N4599_09600 [Limosilactobacillus oris]|uniref:hypothetical protein n=1 Tax=Limosilactobacillus oris TaxID=1632 RepID=UPI0021B1A8AC|nr:hypothetical protein [Limosilactobacillus oris]UXC67326.1 hypothetical protein N4599_09600 [Limosilactobacillus oris]